MRVVCAALIAALCTSCEALELAGYAVWPDVPTVERGERIDLPGLSAPVRVARRDDGLWRIEARDERDAIAAAGYLQARDRMAQLDLFRHVARGELAAWLGEQPFGERTTLEADVLNRFLDFVPRAEALLAATSQAERDALAAFVSGINAWIDEDHRSLEHRLVGAPPRAWTAVDSLAIYQMIMYGLAGNADREVRRLAIACAAGLDAMERIWPTRVEFDVTALPPEDVRPGRHAPRPAVVPELAAALPELCPPDDTADARALPAPPALHPIRALADPFASPWSASNNWTVAGARTSSGRPVLSSDPHLPHMNPPLVWGVEIVLPDHRVAGFTLPGLHRVVFGHNGHVAWGATTNHVDRQDLAIQLPTSPFEERRETFAVRGGEPVEIAVRFSRDGPLLNDLDPFLADRIPLAALRRTPMGRGGDLDAARAMNRARSAGELARALERLDLGCSSWLFADAEGTIAFRSPCLVPVREGWSGAFPVPGWLERYAWRDFVPKSALPASTSPARGWLATANNQIVASAHVPTAYNNDASAPNRYLRIAALLSATPGLDAARSAAIQHDARYESWPTLKPLLCPGEGPAAAVLCAWDGDMAIDAAAPTLYTLFTHAVLDRALADELTDPALWRYVQGLLQFEANVQWLWRRAPDDPVWDDVRTPGVETRGDIYRAALADAGEAARARWGPDSEDWLWGVVRPFVLRHPFASGDGILGVLLNSRPVSVPGGTETVFKQQFARADRLHMRSAVGPVARFSIDMADPWAATYSLAGGESGWPRSRYYGNLLGDWATGRERPLTPGPSPADVVAELRAPMSSRTSP